MEYFVCLKSRIIHSVSPIELALEIISTEPLGKFGYEVIAVDNDDNIHRVSLEDGHVKVH